MDHASPDTSGPNRPDNIVSGRVRRGLIAATVAIVVLTAAAPGSASVVVGDAATAGSMAVRVVPDPADGLLPFPIGAFPRCVVANNFGGFSKAHGPGAHQGVDIGADEGTPVYAVEDGVLTRQLTDPDSSAGLGWILLGVSDTQYRYYHLFDFAEGLEVGSQVERGQRIGSVGSTGNAHPTGWHLHFEVRPGPQPERGSATAVDPVPLLDIPENCTVY